MMAWVRFFWSIFTFRLTVNRLAIVSVEVGDLFIMDIKKIAMFGGAVLLTLVVYRLVFKSFLPASITAFVGV